MTKSKKKSRNKVSINEVLSKACIDPRLREHPLPWEIEVLHGIVRICSGTQPLFVDYMTMTRAEARAIVAFAERRQRMLDRRNK